MGILKDVCKVCRLHEGCKSPCMDGVGPVGAALMLVGESPGDEEDRQGSPFVGRSGDVVRDLLSKLGVRRSQVYITNAVRCHPPRNKTYTRNVDYCQAFLLEEIARVRPKCILALGDSALHSLLGRNGIMKERGQADGLTVGDVVIPVVPTVHPAYVLRNPMAHDFLEWDATLALAISRGERHTRQDVVVDYRLVDSDAALEAMLLDCLQAPRLSWDIETTGLDAMAVDAAVVCIQFSPRPGVSWMLLFDHEERLEFEARGMPPVDACKAAAKFLLESEDAPPLVGQNLKFDRGYVEANLGIVPRRPVADCAILYHMLNEEASALGGGGLKALAWAYTPMGGYERAVERAYPDLYERMRTVPVFSVDPEKPWAGLLYYSCGDTDAVLRVLESLEPLVAAEYGDDYQTVLDFELDKQGFLKDMELRGAPIDWAEHARIVEAFPGKLQNALDGFRAFPEVRQAEDLYAEQRTMKEIRKAMEKAGINPDRPESYALQQTRDIVDKVKAAKPEPFNPKSTDQCRVLAFDVLGFQVGRLTDTDAPSTDKRERQQWLLGLAAEDPRRTIIKRLEVLMQMRDIFSRYIKGLEDQRGRDNRIHVPFNQTRAVTWRLTSGGRGFNMQNLPRPGTDATDDPELRSGRSDIKRLFIPPHPGWWVAEADAAQIELCGAALLSQDPVMCRAIQEQADLHYLLGSFVLPVPAEARQLAYRYISFDPDVTAKTVNETLKACITKEQRSSVKGPNFGIIYLIGAEALAVTAQITEAQAQEFIDSHKQIFRGFWRYVARETAAVKQNGYVRNLFGHIRHLPQVFMEDDPAAVHHAVGQAINTPIQGTMSNLVIRAGVDANEFLKREGAQSYIFNQVHDSLWFTGPPEEKDYAVAVVKTCMENQPFPWLHGEDPRFPISVPFRAEVKIGENFRDLE